MGIWELNKRLEEDIELLERKGSSKTLSSGGKAKPLKKSVKTPIPDDWVEFDVEKGHYWRTIGGKKVMFNKGGKMLNAPKFMKGSEPDKDPGDSKDDSGMWEGPITKKQQKQLDKKKGQLDKLLGKGHGFDVGLNKKGKVAVVHPEVEEAAEQDDKVDSTKLSAEVKGDKIWDLASTLVGMMDMYSGLLIQAGKHLSGVLGKAIGNLRDALEDWQK